MKRIFILILPIIVLSCSKRTKNFDGEKIIDLSQLSQVSVFDLFDSIDVVQLETSDNVLISAISKAIFFNDRYYILDIKQQMLFSFDSSGKFLFKIDRKGQGPDEYLYLGNFNIDSFNSQLLLLEPFGHLLVFDLDGRFIEKIRLPKEINAYNEVYPLDKDNLIFISLSEYHVVFYSKITNEITEKRYLIDQELRSLFSIIGKTYNYNNYVFFSKPFSNEIINLTENTKFLWNFGKDNNQEKQFDKVKKVNINEYVKPGDRNARDYVGEGKINYNIELNHESSRYKICVLDCGKYKFKHIFFDKKENRPIIFEKTKENLIFLSIANFYGEHIVRYEMELPNNSNIQNNAFVTELLTYYSRDLLTEEQKKIIDSRKEDDNPFLVKYNLKQ